MSVVSAFPNGGEISTFANAFSRGDIIDTTERIVGMFDGKPMYQKLINFGALPNSSIKEVAHNITNIDKIVYIDGFCYSRSNPLNAASLNYSANTTATLKYCTSLSTETNNKIRIETTSDFSTWDAYVLLRYTKNTDTANTVKYGTGNDYSTDEQIIGTWINGEKLYQKTVSCGALLNATPKTINHSISNIAKVIDCHGYCYTSSYESQLSLPFVKASDISKQIGLKVDKTSIEIATGTDRSSYIESYVTIRYTKTTG